MTIKVIASQMSAAHDGLMRGSVEFVTDDAAAVKNMRVSLDDMFPGKVIVKCKHCGQFAARKTACGHCGAPVD